MAKRKVKQVESVAESKAETSEKSYTDGPVEGKTQRILVHQDGGANAEYWTDPPLAREVTIGGLPFDHCNTTPDGTWVYRNDRRN